MAVIKECANCGGLAKRVLKRTRKGMRSYIKCSECGMQTGLCKPNGSDLFIWNRRREESNGNG